MGRLIRHSREAGRLQRIEDFYVPSNFDFVVEAVKDVAGFDEDKNIYKTPSLALMLGHSLKKIADILECEAQKAESDNEEFLKNLERSWGLYEKKWDVCVSSRAIQTFKEGKWNTPQLLPFTEDVKNMHMHLDKRRQEYKSRLNNDPNKKNWSKLRQIARECGAKHPETLSSTNLRKHVSTLLTVLNLKDNEMDLLINFLGHDIRVHRQYYRLPEGTLQLAKVSKVLIALEQGRLSDFKGMSLDEIQIDPNGNRKTHTHIYLSEQMSFFMSYLVLSSLLFRGNAGSCGQ